MLVTILFFLGGIWGIVENMSLGLGSALPPEEANQLTQHVIIISVESKSSIYKKNQHQTINIKKTERLLNKSETG